MKKKILKQIKKEIFKDSEISKHKKKGTFSKPLFSNILHVKYKTKVNNKNYADQYIFKLDQLKYEDIISKLRYLIKKSIANTQKYERKNK